MPDCPPRYLIASAQAELLACAAQGFAGAGVEVTAVHSAQAALGAMTARRPPELVLLDAALPGMPMVQLLAEARSAESGERLPILLIADSAAQEWLDLLDEGILDDLIPRQSEPAYWRLRAAGVLRTHRLLHELAQLRENRAHDAQFDRLTGVYGREALLALLFRETDRVQRMSTPLTLLLFDVDDFGHWNARLGRDACDEMLRQMVRRAARLLRTYDLLGRTGNDEFLIALPGCSVANAITLAGRLRLETFSAPFHLAGETIRFSACFGIAQSYGRSPVVVLREAEQALARAKETGPEAIQVFDAPRQPAPAPVTFSSDSGEELLAW